MRIEKLITQNQTLALGKLNVLVGPNNVGKSQTLTDIRNLMTAQSGGIIVRSLQLVKPETLEDLLKGIQMRTTPTEETVFDFGHRSGAEGYDRNTRQRN